MSRIHKDWTIFAQPLGFVRLILLVDWDPIGLLGYPETMDEYDSYAAEVHDLLVADASPENLVHYLQLAQAEDMGVRGKSLSDLEAIATKLRTTFDTARADQR